MKREILAAAFLAALFALSLWNIRHIDALTQSVVQHLELSEKAACSGDSATAEAELDYALSLWSAADRYTQIFIRHPEIDSTYDAFYQLAEGLERTDAQELRAKYSLLRYHLDCIASMEHLSFGSIL